MSAIALCIERPLARKRVSSSSPGVVAQGGFRRPEAAVPFQPPPAIGGDQLHRKAGPQPQLVDLSPRRRPAGPPNATAGGRQLSRNSMPVCIVPSLSDLFVPSYVDGQRIRTTLSRLTVMGKMCIIYGRKGGKVWKLPF